MSMRACGYLVLSCGVAAVAVTGCASPSVSRGKAARGSELGARRNDTPVPTPSSELRAPSRSEATIWTVRSPRTPAVIELPGEVVAVRAATLAAPVAGQVRALAEEGSELPAGGEAAALEAAGLPEQLRAAQAARDAAERRRGVAQTAVRQAVQESTTTQTTLQRSLEAAQAERDRRRALLAQARVQAAVEPSRLRAQLRAAEARVRLLRSGEREQRIRQLEAELEFKRAELKVAQGQLQRRQELLAKGYVSRSDVELAELAVQRARANELQQVEELTLAREGAHPEAIQEAEQQLEATRASLRAAAGLAAQVAERRAELAGARAELAKAQHALQTARTGRLSIVRAQQEAAAADAEARRWEAELAEARSRLARATVRAPFAGQVVRRRARPGETVMTGAPLLDLVDPHRLEFEASASQSDLSHLCRGSRVQVMIPSADSPPPMLREPAGDAGHGALATVRSTRDRSLRREPGSGTGSAAGSGWREGQAPRPRAGRVVEVIMASDPTTRAHPIRIRLASTAGLRPGMPGVARLTLPPSVARVRLPLACLWDHFPRQQRAEYPGTMRSLRVSSPPGHAAADRAALLDRVPGDQI